MRNQKEVNLNVVMCFIEKDEYEISCRALIMMFCVVLNYYVKELKYDSISGCNVFMYFHCELYTSLNK